jgi:hypothetical protein
MSSKATHWYGHRPPRTRNITKNNKKNNIHYFQDCQIFDQHRIMVSLTTIYNSYQLYIFIIVKIQHTILLLRFFGWAPELPRSPSYGLILFKSSLWFRMLECSFVSVCRRLLIICGTSLMSWESCPRHGPSLKTSQTIQKNIYMTRISSHGSLVITAAQHGLVSGKLFPNLNQPTQNEAIRMAQSYRYDLIWYDLIWSDLIRYDLVRHDLIR